ncbi:unnamed protein product [Cuscuta epithymum]|uniref:Uncharacterized protein n=1 Tax=Cuscuta epithymum TaxID=186058 RepID=A0AAV0FKF3_9ASTE|nr:unnamed protein product [Cuscuta epithymum]
MSLHFPGYIFSPFKKLFDILTILNLQGLAIVYHPFYFTCNAYHFPVYVESTFLDCSYMQLFCPASFLYVLGKIPEETCVAFLNRCYDKRGRMLIEHGTESEHFLGVEMDLLQEIQMVFHINQDSSLTFFLRMVVEEPPPQAYIRDQQPCIHQHCWACLILCNVCFSADVLLLFCYVLFQ